MGILIPRDLRTNRTSTAVWLASKRRDFIRNGGIAGLGPELQANWDMSAGVTDWSLLDCTIQAVDDGGDDAVLITSTINSGTSVASLLTPTLTVSNSYRVRIKARRGAQGVEQSTKFWSWATIPATLITSSSYQIYEFDAVATSASGLTRAYATSGGAGAIGDEVYVSEISIREIL